MTISPLAPASFPDLPVIDGVTFAAAAAGVKHADRLDVMLALLAEGTAWRGCSPPPPRAPPTCLIANANWRCAQRPCRDPRELWQL